MGTVTREPLLPELSLRHSRHFRHPRHHRHPGHRTHPLTSVIANAMLCAAAWPGQRTAKAISWESERNARLCEMPVRNEYCQTSSVQDMSVKIRARHLWNDTLATIGVLAFVLAVLISIDERVREQTALIMSPGAVTSIPAQLREVGSALVDAAQTQSLEHAPLMSFVVVATVLLLGMMRK